MACGTGCGCAGVELQRPVTCQAPACAFLWPMRLHGEQTQGQSGATVVMGGHTLPGRTCVWARRRDLVQTLLASHGWLRRPANSSAANLWRARLWVSYLARLQWRRHVIARSRHKGSRHAICTRRSCLGYMDAMCEYGFPTPLPTSMLEQLERTHLAKRHLVVEGGSRGMSTCSTPSPGAQSEQACIRKGAALAHGGYAWA